MKCRPNAPLLICFLLLCLFLGSCSLPVAHRAQGVQQQNQQATQAAFLVQTEIARSLNTATSTLAPTAAPTTAQPNQTATPTGPAATPSPAGPVVTALPGLVLYSHPDLPDYVFQIDPGLWEKDPSGKTADLVHTSLANCRVESVPGHGLDAPERYFWSDLGRFRWEVMDYGSSAFVYPVLGAGLGELRSRFLALPGYNKRACRAAQEEVLGSLMLSSEAAGQIGFVPFASPTPREALADFSCPDMPPARLRTGDWVSIITNGLWLRSEPRADNSTKVTQYLRNAPVTVLITGGPVCEKYVYWQVEACPFGEGSQCIRGWMAEGDGEEYFLETVRSGGVR